ncbi:MAG TPA: glycosyltransferase family 2 protein [Candidatus Saccharimonadales bacterium]
MKKSVAVVIPTVNGARHLRRSVPSILKQSYKNYTVIVVDNNSKNDDTASYLAELSQKHSNFIALTNADNLGFTGGVNAGIRFALMHDFDYIALLNNDAVVEEGWVGALVQPLEEKPEVAIATSLILHADGKTIDSTGDWFSVWGLPFPRTRDHPAIEAPKAGYVFGASGGASMYRASFFRELGIFDNYYFAYYEDVDISFRAQLKGQKVFYTPQARTYHGQGETSKTMPGFSIRQAFRNYPRLVLKNVPFGLIWKILPRFLLAYLLFLGNAIRRGNGQPALEGLLQSFTLSWQALWRERKKIQKLQTVSNKTLYASFWPDLPPDQTGLRKFRDTFVRRKK